MDDPQRNQQLPLAFLDIITIKFKQMKTLEEKAKDFIRDLRIDVSSFQEFQIKKLMAAKMVEFAESEKIIVPTDKTKIPGWELKELEKVHVTENSNMKTEAIIKNFLKKEGFFLLDDSFGDRSEMYLSFSQLVSLCTQVAEAQNPGKKLGIAPTNKLTGETEGAAEIKHIVLDEYEKGNIVVYTCEGLKQMKLEDIVKQPVEGLLYDLNRDEATILTLISDPKWINDFASCQVIRKLYDMMIFQMLIRECEK